jgi:hypothetical protein
MWLMIAEDHIAFRLMAQAAKGMGTISNFPGQA